MTYRKPTFTGLGLSFTSFIPIIYKTNSIVTLLNRAYITCTDWISFHREVKKLIKYFLQNRYPRILVEKIIKRFIYKKIAPKEKVSEASKLKFNVTLPYYGPLNKEIDLKLEKLLQSSFPHIDFRLVATNKVRLQNLFTFKDKLPKVLKSCVTYLYTCDCSLQYIGSTTANLHTRMSQHMGISERTGLERKSKNSSSIREHSESSGHLMTFDNFKIIGNANTNEDLRILEAIQIKIRNPSLNKQMESIHIFTV